MRTKKVVAAVLAATALTVATVPALAQDQSPTETKRLEERLDVICGRVPRLTERVENALARIQGGADTRGSILWLEEKAVDARRRGYDDLASYLESRIAIRTERIDVLQLRLEWLAEVAEICADR